MPQGVTYLRQVEYGITGILPGKSGIGSTPTYPFATLTGDIAMYVLLNQNVHNRSHNGARYNAGGAGVQPKHFACTKKTAIPKPGWVFTHKEHPLETIEILRQLPADQYLCKQTYGKRVVTYSLKLTTNDIRHSYNITSKG